MKVPTPHNAAIAGQIAPTVIMPGDPLRAKFIAKPISNPPCYNTVRGMLGYTGRYKGRRYRCRATAWAFHPWASMLMSFTTFTA